MGSSLQILEEANHLQFHQQASRKETESPAAHSQGKLEQTWKPVNKKSQAAGFSGLATCLGKGIHQLQIPVFPLSLPITGSPVLAGQKPTVQVCPSHVQQETQPGTESETVPGLYDDEFS